MLANFYGNSFVSLFNGEIDFTGGAVKTALLVPGHTPDLDTHNYFDDVAADEVSGTGYTQGGLILGTPSVTYNGATNLLTIDGDNAVWDPSTVSAGFALVYLDTGTDSTSPLIALLNFEGTISSNNGPFTVTWDAAGIATVTVD
ncbi:MAG: hypothetical protein [Phage AS32]|nr:MAG: hypothetical protein [Phage AS32]